MSAKWHIAPGHSFSEKTPNIKQTFPGGVCTVNFNLDHFFVRISRTRPIQCATQAKVRINQFASAVEAYAYAKHYAEQLLTFVPPPIS
jgi:hypothetical protein